MTAVKRSKLRTLALVLRLMCKAPGLLLRTSRAYRGFRRAFIASAAAQGMPPQVARELARGLRPMAVFRSLKHRHG